MKNSAIIRAFLFFIFVFSFYGISAQNWEVTYAEALTKANKEQKPLIIVFAGSDWCAPCIKLEKSIWQSKEFISYSMEHYILYKADFPRKKKNQLSKELTEANKLLADSYNPQGHFPLVVVLSANENVLGEVGFKKIQPKAYISLINSFTK